MFLRLSLLEDMQSNFSLSGRILALSDKNVCFIGLGIMGTFKPYFFLYGQPYRAN